MKKALSIFLLALYAMSVSASVVSIRYCDEMRQQTVTSALNSQGCCCSDGHSMKMDPPVNSDRLPVTKTTQQNAAYNIDPNGCCTEIVLETRLTANQIISSENENILNQTPKWVPATIPDHLAFQPNSVNLHQPMAAAFTVRPTVIPLYKLFQRFTYYG